VLDLQRDALIARDTTAFPKPFTGAHDSLYRRHMKLLLSWATLVIVLMTGSAEAARILGAGTGSCGTWTADRRNTEGSYARKDGQWILGFLSGMVWSGPYYGRGEILKGMDAEGVWPGSTITVKLIPLGT
jgi:hypothetical protein